MNTDFGSNYPSPPDGISKRKWGKACDAVAQRAWTHGVAPDWREAEAMVV